MERQRFFVHTSIALLAFGSPAAARAAEPVVNSDGAGSRVAAQQPATSEQEARHPTPGIQRPEASSGKPLFQHTTYPAAWQAAQSSNRPILIYVGMPNCPHCVKMMQQTYHRPHVERMIAGSFETIKAGRDTHATLVQRLHIKWYPTTVLVSPNNKVLDVIEGFVDAQRFQQRLQTGLASAAPTSHTR